MYVYKSVAESRVTNAYHIIHSALTESRSPAGPRRLRNSDAHKRIAVPQALCVLREYTRPGDVCERAERSEGSDTTPTQNATCFGV